MTYQDVAGAFFNPSAGASGLRLTLDANGDASLEKWLDLGGKWMKLRTGRFLLVGDVVLTTFRDIDWCATSFAQDGELHVRRLALRRAYDEPELELRIVLAPSDTIEELDKLMEASPPGMGRLEESFLALKLFIEQR
jgi:hypothetical protein